MEARRLSLDRSVALVRRSRTDRGTTMPSGRDIAEVTRRGWHFGANPLELTPGTVTSKKWQPSKAASSVKPQRPRAIAAFVHSTRNLRRNTTFAWEQCSCYRAHYPD